MGTDPLLAKGKLIVFFDTSCLLCNRFVKILLKFDKNNLYYSGFDSQIAKDILPERLRNQPQSVVFYQEGDLFLKSIAILKITSYLRQPLPILVIFRILPRALCDFIYDWVARNRVSWFGRSKTCFLPSPEQRDRFFDF